MDYTIRKENLKLYVLEEAKKINNFKVKIINSLKHLSFIYANIAVIFVSKNRPVYALHIKTKVCYYYKQMDGNQKSLKTVFKY